MGRPDAILDIEVSTCKLLERTATPASLGNVGGWMCGAETTYNIIVVVIIVVELYVGCHACRTCAWACACACARTCAWACTCTCIFA